MRHITDVNDKDAFFEANFSMKRPTVIAFFRYFSIPCDHFEPEYLLTSEALWRRVTFYRCNTEENPSVVDTFKLTETPTTIFFRNGEEVDRWGGPYSREFLTARIKGLLKRTRKRT